MGCAPTKPLMDSSHPPQIGLNKLKMENGYVRKSSSSSSGGPKDKKEGKKITSASRSTGSGGTTTSSSGGGSGGGGGMRRSSSNISDEVVDGWPKWLTDNIPKDALEGLVPKSADAYDKLDKVSYVNPSTTESLLWDIKKMCK